MKTLLSSCRVIALALSSLILLAALVMKGASNPMLVPNWTSGDRFQIRLCHPNVIVQRGQDIINDSAIQNELRKGMLSCAKPIPTPLERLNAPRSPSAQWDVEVFIRSTAQSPFDLHKLHTPFLQPPSVGHAIDLRAELFDEQMRPLPEAVNLSRSASDHVWFEYLSPDGPFITCPAHYELKTSVDLAAKFVRSNPAVSPGRYTSRVTLSWRERGQPGPSHVSVDVPIEITAEDLQALDNEAKRRRTGAVPDPDQK